MNCLSRKKRAKMTLYVTLHTNPVAPSALNKPTATLRCCAVSFTWLENGNVMNQRLYVQRPSVLNRLLRFEHLTHYYAEREENNNTHTHSPYPSHQKYNRWCFKLMLTGIQDNFLRKWILQIFSGFPSLRARSGRSGVSALPPSCVQL